MSMRLLLVAAFHLFATTVAQAAEYTRVNTSASQISFTYNQMGSRMYGTFGKFEATLDFPQHKGCSYQSKGMKA